MHPALARWRIHTRPQRRTSRMSADRASQRTDSIGASLRAWSKVAAILLSSAVAMPLQWLVLRFTKSRAAFRIPRLWFGSLAAILGIQAEVVGTPRQGGRTLFVGNHVSHFDIPLLGSVLRARFIAKDDMARWPGMSFVGGLGQVLFISRRSRDAASVTAEIAAQLQPDHDLVLFAEGTTSSGESVAPFKSSLFSLFLGAPAESAWTLQPFTLDIRSVDGVALTDAGDRCGYAYYGDMDAGAHVKHFLRTSGATVRVVFHAPIAVTPGTDRKTLAAQVHAVVASGLSAAHTHSTRPAENRMAR